MTRSGAFETRVTNTGEGKREEEREKRGERGKEGKKYTVPCAHPSWLLIDCNGDAVLEIKIGTEEERRKGEEGGEKEIDRLQISGTS